jgi:hypothetical protein
VRQEQDALGFLSPGELVGLLDAELDKLSNPSELDPGSPRHFPDAQRLLGLAGPSHPPQREVQQRQLPLFSDSEGLPPLAHLANPVLRDVRHEAIDGDHAVSSAAPRQHRPAAGSPQGRSASRSHLGWPERPTTPELMEPLRARIAARSTSSQRSLQGRALNRVEQALQQALQSRQRRQALQEQGISVGSSQMTPVLEQFERQARVHLHGLSDDDMSPQDQAFFMTVMLREQLSQETAAGEEPRRLAQPASQKQGDKALASAESGELARLAAAYAGRALGLDAAATELLQRRVSGLTPRSREFQLKLRDLGQRHGPVAMALVHKLYGSSWVGEHAVRNSAGGDAKTSNSMPAQHRSAFVDALLQMEPGAMDRLIAAARDPDRSGAIARLFADVRADMDADPSFANRRGSWLDHALERLQGRDPAFASYSDAPPAGDVLPWLLSKTPPAAGQ